MYCKKCGTLNENSLTRCKHCGYRIRLFNFNNKTLYTVTLLLIGIIAGSTVGVFSTLHYIKINPSILDIDYPVTVSFSDRVAITKEGKCYHSSRDCPSLKRSKRISWITVSNAKSKGMKACSVCIK